LDTPVDGSTLMMKRHQIAKAGQVILSEIWGKKGAIGLVPKEGEGALCTSHFFLFNIRKERLDPGWIDAIFRANYLEDQLSDRSRGTTGYAAVRPKDLLAAKIPLPPLPEQRRIVGRIEGVAGKIAASRGLCDQVVANQDKLLRSILYSDGEAKLTPMKMLVRLREPDVTVQPEETYHFAGVLCFGRGVFKARKLSGSEFSYPRLTRLHVGNFVYPKLMAWEGAFGVVPPLCDNCVVSTEFPVFEINRDRVLPDVLDVHFRSPAVWPQIAGASTGTNVRRRRLNPSDFLELEIPVPSMKTQQLLQTITRRVSDIHDVHSSASATLDALLPSVLDRAFKGEL
jgi:type I restriction enzyme S subunit